MRLIWTLGVLMLISTFSRAALIVSNGTGGGDWTIGTTWAGGVAPIATDDVHILATDVVTFPSNRTCVNFTLDGTLNFTTNTRTLTVNGNFTTAANAIVIGGGTNRIMNVSGTFTVPTGTTADIQGIGLTVSSNGIIDGTLRFSTNAAGTKTFSNDFIVNNGGSIVFDVAEGLNVTGNLTANGTCSLLSGTANGSFNVNGNTTFAAGSDVTLANGTIATTGVGNVFGNINITNTAGNKNFISHLNLNNGSSINFTAGETLQCSGNLTLSGSVSISGSATGIVNVSNNASVSAGASVNWGRAAWTVNGNLVVDGAVLSTNTNGNFNFNSSVDINNAGSLSFNATRTVTIGSQLNLYPGSTLGNGSASGNVTVTGDVNVNTGGTTIINHVTLTSNSNFSILGTAVLDASGNNFVLDLYGNWINSSTAPSPFIEGNSIVSFLSAVAAQSITVTGANENFYAVVFNNTSGLNPAITTNKDLIISGEVDLLSGIVDLAGNDITVNSVVSAAATCSFSAGQIITSVAGSSISIQDDASDLLIVDFTGTDIGDATNSIPLTVNTGRSCYEDLEIYGVASLTKTLNTDDVCTGGNIFHHAVTFTATSTASRWRMGDGASAQPDIFYGNATFNANATAGSNNNFIIGANSLGNEYYGTTTFSSTTLGGFYIGRSNGTGNNSHTFHGPVVINVAFDGNVVLGDAAATNTSTIVLESTIQLNSTATSIGDIYVGSISGFSTITFNVNGRIIDGNILGATNIYFNSITQNNALANNTTSGAATASTIYVGNSLAANACVFNGNVTFVSPNITLRGSTFNGTNSFQANGITNFTSYGGNTFNGNTTFINNGTGYWRLANNASDDFNANATFNQISSGALAPAYGFDCTFAGNITTINNPITFAAGAGRVILDGTTNQFLSGVSPTCARMRVNKSSGTLTQNWSTLTITNEFDFLAGILTIAPTNMLIFNDNSNAINESSNSFADGMVRKIGNDAFDFPVGDNGEYARISISAPTNAAHFFTAEYFNANPDLVPYDITSKDVTLNNISTCEYWILDRGAATTSNVTVTLTWDTRSCGVTDPATLAVARWNGSTWKDHGNGGTLGTPASGSIVTSGVVTSFSPFTLASYSSLNPLPVELTEFSATPKISTVELKWTTKSESGTKNFIVQRSMDGEYWQDLLIEPASGNSSSELNYSRLDESPLGGVSYYRLKIVDADGEFDLSEIEQVEFKNASTSLIYPNPSNGIINLYNTSTGLKIYNVTGEILYSSSGQYHDVSYLPDGVYVGALLDNFGNILYTKIVIEK